MIKTFELGGGQSLTLETRATGNIRISISHPGYQVTSANIDPQTGADIGRAMLQMAFSKLVQALKTDIPVLVAVDDQDERGG